jgi:hypothetical protein
MNSFFSSLKSGDAFYAIDTVLIVMVDIKNFLLGSESLFLPIVCSHVLEKCIEYICDQTFLHSKINKIKAGMKFIFYNTL